MKTNKYVILALILATVAFFLFVDLVVFADEPSGCMDESTREARLICLDPLWRSGGDATWINGLGFEGRLTSRDARQPDEQYIPNFGMAVRGVQVTASGSLPDGLSCVTTDVPSRISSYGVVFYIPFTKPIVGMYGGGVSFSGPISIWADCSDWPEFVSVLDGRELSDSAQPVATVTQTPRVRRSRSTPTPQVIAPQPAGFPQDFCLNADGRHFNGDNRLPANDPCAGSASYQVVGCEVSRGQWSRETLDFASYDEVRNSCLAGIIWAVPNTLNSGLLSQNQEEATPVPPTPEVSSFEWPAGFCDNIDGIHFGGDNPLPVQNPCSGPTSYEVVGCETARGVFASESQVYAVYGEVASACLSGIIWALPIRDLVTYTPTATVPPTDTPTVVPTDTATATPTPTVTVTPTVELTATVTPTVTVTPTALGGPVASATPFRNAGGVGHRQ